MGTFSTRPSSFLALSLLYRHHFREEKEHVVNGMDHWLLALGPGAALV